MTTSEALRTAYKNNESVFTYRDIIRDRLVTPAMIVDLINNPTLYPPISSNKKIQIATLMAEWSPVDLANLLFTFNKDKDSKACLLEILDLVKVEELRLNNYVQMIVNLFTSFEYKQDVEEILRNYIQ